MSDTVISQIENTILSLSVEEQRQLLSRLVERLRLQTEPESFDRELFAMAADEDIQRELRRIDSDFRRTEFDGLGE